MSQLLRLAGRSFVSYSHHPGTETFCKTCHLLRNGFRESSTNSKKQLEPYLRYKRKKWKTAETDRDCLHEQLTRTLNSRMVQLSSAMKDSYDPSREDFPVDLSGTNSVFIDSLKQDIETMKALRSRLSPMETVTKDFPHKFRDKKSKHSLQKTLETNLNTFSNERSRPESYKGLTSDVQHNYFEKTSLGTKTKESVIAEQSERNKETKNFNANRKQHSSVVKGSDVKKSKLPLQTGKPGVVIKKGKGRGKKVVLSEFFERKNAKIEERIHKLNKTQRDESRLLQGIMGAASVGLKPFNLEMNLNTARKIFQYKPNADSNNIPESTYVAVEHIQAEEDIFCDISSEPLTSISDKAHLELDFTADCENANSETEEKLLRYINHPLVPQQLSSGDRVRSVDDPFMEIEILEEEMMEEWLDNGSIEGIITNKAKQASDMQRMEKYSKENASLLKTAEFNNDLRCYVDACIMCGLVNRALHDVQHYRKLHGQGGEQYAITNIDIYNSLLRGVVKMKKGLDVVREVFSCIKADGLQPTMQTYAICLASIGHQSDYDVMIATFIVRDMKKQGLDVNDIFNQCVFLHNERHCVYKVLKAVIPNFLPNPPHMSDGYKGPLVESLNQPLPLSEVISTSPLAVPMKYGDLMKKVEHQFSNELDGYITVESIFKGKMQRKQLEKQETDTLVDLVEENRPRIREAFIAKKEVFRTKAYGKDGINVYPFLCLFRDEDYVEIICRQAQKMAQYSPFYSEDSGVVERSLARQVYDRYIVQQKMHVEIFDKLYKAYSCYTERLSDSDKLLPNQRLLWKEIVQELSDGNSMELPDRSWSYYVHNTIGKELLEIILKHFLIKPELDAKKMAKCFMKVQRSVDNKFTFQIKPHPSVTRIVTAQQDIIFPTTEVPMLCPPVPFTAPDHGGDLLNTVTTVRNCSDRQQKMFAEASRQDCVGPIFDALNVLGTCSWRINKQVLDVAIKVFNDGGNPDIDIPLLPSLIPKPVKPKKGEATPAEMSKYHADMRAYQKYFGEATSLWWTDLYKFSIANKFKDEVFWLPMNMDFRGRTYPVPPHLNHTGNDVVRGMLLFAKGKPLGPKGLDWLMIHLVNLTGKKKRASNVDRLAYAHEILPDILDSADHPLTGNKWWMTSDEPWQTLGSCMEVASAYRSRDPASFISHFPVHQDGSCNGLQHYAAMGRDELGAKSVNLYPYEIPSDVYSEVVELVKKEIETDIKEDTKDRAVAEIAREYLERKVIKQSIMTTVYGVTFFGAVLQIKKQLKDKEVPDDHVKDVSVYLTNKTFTCLNKMFNSAREIQAWFNECAEAISLTDRPVEWVTPLNFPVLQPYFKVKAVRTQGTRVYVNDTTVKKIDSMKQKNGFAPNFVHSLDSTHMMLTALYCYRKGITFMSVHDCYWTHAADIEVMNKITREQFTALHNQPILEDLSAYFEQNFGEAIDRSIAIKKLTKRSNPVTDVPEKGSFDLDNVLKSTYFFS